MKSVRIATIFLCCACVAACLAQITSGPKGPQHTSPVKPRSTEARMAAFAKKLSLTVDQKNKITKIMNIHFERLKILAKNSKISDSDRKSKIAADRALVNKQIRALLNTRQQKIFDTMLAEDAKKRHKMSQPPSKPSQN
jgi:Spy/CpxP family protein refolding chaperone